MVHGSQQTSFSSSLSRSAVSGPQASGQNISTQTLDSMDLTDTDVALWFCWLCKCQFLARITLYICSTYSKTSMSRTPKARLPCLNLNRFFSLYIKKKFRIIFRIFCYSIMKMDVVCTHLNRLIEAILMTTQNIHNFIKDRKDILKLFPLASWPGA